MPRTAATRYFLDPAGAVIAVSKGQITVLQEITMAKRRGRKPKGEADATSESEGAEPKKRRGRKPKAKAD